MKLTPNVLNVLKNFSTINGGIRFKEGNQLDTISQAENIVAYADIDEKIPRTFSVYDLNEFLSVVSLFKEPQLVFESDKYAKITEEGSRSSVRYYFADENVVKTFDQTIDFPEAEVTFTLSQENLQAVLKAASILQSPTILIKGVNGEMQIITTDPKEATSNNYIIDIGEYDGDDFEFYFNAENLKMVPKTYTVEVSSQLISKFTSEDGESVYYIGVEDNSYYG